MMKHLIIASSRKSAGKTSMIAGLAGLIGKPCGYMKPFGDRLLYRKKRLWDYDSAVLTGLWGLTDVPEEMSLGFDHAKLKYIFSDKEQAAEKLIHLASVAAKGKEILFTECGQDLSFGESVNLDPLTLARVLNGSLVVVLSGQDGAIMDHIYAIRNHLQMDSVDFRGIVINKVGDPTDFRNTYQREIESLKIPLLSVLPVIPELTYMSMEYISEKLFAKVIAGEKGLGNIVKNILVGAMSVDSALTEKLLSRENKLVITSGDRPDMILAALEHQAAGVVITNNILPPSQIIAKAETLNIPLLLVSYDTFQATTEMDRTEALLTRGDTEKISIVSKILKNDLDIRNIIG